MLSNSSPSLRRLYHLVLPKDFYDENFGEDCCEDWDVVTSQAADFKSQTANLQLMTLELPLQFVPGRTLVGEVFITSGGIKFHFVEDCPGLAKRQNPLKAITFADAKALGRTLCAYCHELTQFRTPTCSTPTCNFTTTWMPHFCCRRCKDKRGHGKLCDGRKALEAAATCNAGTSSGSTQAINTLMNSTSMEE